MERRKGKDGEEKRVGEEEGRNKGMGKEKGKGAEEVWSPTCGPGEHSYADLISAV